MQTSEMINELAASLAKAQALVKGAMKDATNPHFRSSYADLSSVWDACREALTTNGLSVVQAPASGDDGAVCVSTRLLHASGQWMETTICCRPAKNDAQGLGSVITYLRRYTLAAMVGVAPEDDDGESATGRGKGGQPLGDIAPKSTTTPKDVATKSEDWQPGPARNVTQLKSLMKDFGRDLEACSDLDMFEALMGVRVEVEEGKMVPIKDIHAQCEANLKSWWFGDGGDVKGAAKRIEEMREYLTGKEADHQSFAA